jgi:serine/threonine-protein kinase
MREEQQVKLDALLRGAMAESPDLRTRGAEGMADALREWLGLSPQRGSTAGTPDAGDAAAAKPTAWWKRWLWLGAAAGLSLLALTARVVQTETSTAAPTTQARG